MAYICMVKERKAQNSICTSTSLHSKAAQYIVFTDLASPVFGPMLTAQNRRLRQVGYDMYNLL